MRLVYIAGKFSNRKFYREIAVKLLPHQMAITSRWIWEDEADFYEVNAEEHRRLGQRDLADIDGAHTLIIDTEGPLAEGSGGGRELELGYALARGKEIWRVGPARNVFHEQINIRFRHWQEVLNNVK